jgi:hypothetical protein
VVPSTSLFSGAAVGGTSSAEPLSTIIGAINEAIGSAVVQFHPFLPAPSISWVLQVNNLLRKKEAKIQSWGSKLKRSIQPSRRLESLRLRYLRSSAKKKQKQKNPKGVENPEKGDTASPDHLGPSSCVSAPSATPSGLPTSLFHLPRSHRQPLPSGLPLMFKVTFLRPLQLSPSESPFIQTLFGFCPVNCRLCLHHLHQSQVFLLRVVRSKRRKGKKQMGMMRRKQMDTMRRKQKGRKIQERRHRESDHLGSPSLCTSVSPSVELSAIPSHPDC